MTSQQHRETVLDEAKKAVLSDRNVEYGDPEDNFAHIAGLWNAYLQQPLFEPYDVANLMNLVKIARSTTSPRQMDHWTDQAGYAACGYAAAMAGEKSCDHASQTFEAKGSWWCDGCGQEQPA